MLYREAGTEHQGLTSQASLGIGKSSDHIAIGRNGHETSLAGAVHKDLASQAWGQEKAQTSLAC
jgi:hypothetical protein